LYDLHGTITQKTANFTISVVQINIIRKANNEDRVGRNTNIPYIEIRLGNLRKLKRRREGTKVEGNLVKSERDYEHLVLIKEREYFDQLNDCQFVEKKGLSQSRIRSYFQNVFSFLCSCRPGK
jgi:hypothetical protein